MNGAISTRGLSVLRNLSVRGRLALGFGAVVALLAASAALGIGELASLDRTVERLTGQDLAAERAVNDWRMATQANLPRVVAVTLSGDAAIATYFPARIEGATLRIAALQDKARQALVSARDKAAFADVLARREAYVAARREAERLRAAGQAADATRVVWSKLSPAIDEFAESQAKLAALIAEETSARARASRALARAGRVALAVFAGLGAAAAVILGMMIATSILRPVTRATEAVSRLATGDLSQPIPVRSRSEFGRMMHAFESMRATFAASVHAIQAAARDAGRLAEETARGNAELAARTEEQASTLEEAAGSMEEIAAAVKQNTESAGRARDLAQGAAEVATRGGNVVAEAVSTMQGISDSSRRIGEIIGVIDGIAFQTNILALNAAIEAARAGEQGRGFAVVASEVRSLAQRSAAAAREIKALIGESSARVDSGARQVEAAGKTMDEIVASARRVTDVIAEISGASQEQLAGIEQVGLAVTQLDRATQQNSALVEASAAASERMARQAQALLEAVARFKVLAAGEAASKPADGGPARLPAP